MRLTAISVGEGPVDEGEGRGFGDVVIAAAMAAEE